MRFERGACPIASSRDLAPLTLLCFGYANENLEPWRENGATWELLAPEVGYDQPMFMFMDERWEAWVEPPSRIARLSDYRLRGGGAHKL